MTKILLVEDDFSFSNLLQKFLAKQSYEVDTTSSLKQGAQAMASSNYDLVLLDYRLPDGTAIDFMSGDDFRSARVPVIIMTTFDNVRTAVMTMKMGAKDYITKPINTDDLLSSIKEVLKPTQQSESASSNQWIKGKSEISKQMHEHIELVAPTDFSVLIEGESGVGKEYVAMTIHRQSNRSHKPFIAVDCGALSPDLAASELFGHTKGSFTSAIQDKKGHFEMANGGTLFLDEISNLNYDNQVKLLRALQEKSVQPVGSNRPLDVDIRLITATNDDLHQQVKAGKFREDLYHRVHEFKITVPPLRSRRSDIALFVSHFIEKTNERLGKNVVGLTAEVMELFNDYKWPGNLRELKNMIKRSVLLAEGEKIGLNDLPHEMVAMPMSEAPQLIKQDASSDLKVLQQHNEKLMIISTLKNVKHNKSKAAQLLNIDRKTLYNKLAKYDIE